MGFTKPIEQYLFCNLLTKIHVFTYLKDIIRGGRKYVFWWFLLKSGVKWFKMEHILNYSRDVYENSGRQLCLRELMKILLTIKIE